MSAASYEGAQRDPFALTASADDYVPTQAIGRVLDEAVAALSAGRVPVISGPTGLGKTLALQLLGRACADHCQPLYVPYCSLAPDELASLVLGLLEWDREADPEMGLLDVARRLADSGRRLLLLIDDAASLPGDTAAALAHWLNASGGALQIALAGLPGAALRHARDAFGDGADEVVLADGLRSEEIRRYVEARLDAAGAEPAIRAAFDAGALAELERVSGGNPRRLNLAAQAIVRNAYGASVGAAAGRAAKPSTSATARVPEASSPQASPPRPRAPDPWQDLAEIGEYRFVRGRFIDPRTGDTLATPQTEGVWREELHRTERERATRRSPGPRAEPELEIDADLGLDREAELAAERALAVGAERSAADDALLYAPKLEPPAAARRRGSMLRWIATGVAGIAFAIGAWTQLRGGSGSGSVAVPAPPAATIRRVTPEPMRPPAEEPSAEASRPEIVPVAPEALVPAVVLSAPEALVPAAPEPLAPPPIAEESAEETAGSDAAALASAPSLELEPLAVAETPTTAVPGAAAGSEAGLPEATAEQEVPPEPPAELVSIAINATPWAVIEIDGEEVGETPLAGIELTTGRHRFRARMPDGSVRERVVRIDANTPTVVFE